jgi:hypothetical protein
MTTAKSNLVVGMGARGAFEAAVESWSKQLTAWRALR